MRIELREDEHDLRFWPEDTDPELWVRVPGVHIVGAAAGRLASPLISQDSEMPLPTLQGSAQNARVEEQRAMRAELIQCQPKLAVT
mmetsp:Transcript_31565/g.96627  ORF Transcript_31565/g.96627 Transcript_31565/m.96627 type:complete len:86 (+) Transcript_31565:2330-2587(+)